MTTKENSKKNFEQSFLCSCFCSLMFYNCPFPLIVPLRIRKWKDRIKPTWYRSSGLKDADAEYRDNWSLELLLDGPCDVKTWSTFPSVRGRIWCGCKYLSGCAVMCLSRSQGQHFQKKPFAQKTLELRTASSCFNVPESDIRAEPPCDTST